MRAITPHVPATHTSHRGPASHARVTDLTSRRAARLSLSLSRRATPRPNVHREHPRATCVAAVAIRQHNPFQARGLLLHSTEAEPDLYLRGCLVATAAAAFRFHVEYFNDKKLLIAAVHAQNLALLPPSLLQLARQLLGLAFPKLDGLALEIDFEYCTYKRASGVPK